MPVSKPSDLPVGGGGRWPLCGRGFKSVQWGDLEVGHTTVAGPTDASAGYHGLPGSVCQCPHYGYVFSGSVRCHYPDSDWPDEVAEAGDVYFFRAGHHLSYPEASEVLELNPAYALQVLMDHIEAGAQRAAEAAGAGASAD